MVPRQAVHSSSQREMLVHHVRRFRFSEIRNSQGPRTDIASVSQSAPPLVEAC